MKIILIMAHLLILVSFTTYAEELTIITENAPPNSYEENGKLTGRTVEIVKAVLNEIGMEGYPIKIFPWARGYNLLLNNKNIALFATTRSSRRESLFKWVGPIMTNQIHLYKLKSRSDIRVHRLEDLKRYRVGGVIEDVKSQYLEAEGIQIQKVNQEIQNIHKLFRGRVDIIPYAAVRFNYDIKKSGYNPDNIEKIFYLKTISKQLYVAFSKQTEDSLIEKFQLGFDKIRKNGIYEEIIQKWKNQ